MSNLLSAAAYHPVLAGLREQLEGLLQQRAPAAAASAAAPASGLLQKALDNLPMLMEAGTLLMGLLRPAQAEAAPQHVSPPPRRRGVLRPVLIVAAVAGAAYLVSRTMNGNTGRRVQTQ